MEGAASIGKNCIVSNLTIPVRKLSLTCTCLNNNYYAMCLQYTEHTRAVSNTGHYYACTIQDGCKIPDNSFLHTIPVCDGKECAYATFAFGRQQDIALA